MSMTARTGAQWRRHEQSAGIGTIVSFVVTVLVAGLVAAMWRTDIAGVIGVGCIAPTAVLLALALYSMGPHSGWAGLWTIRVFREADDVDRRVAAALANAGRGAHRAPDRKPSRWLRTVGPPMIPVELADGTLVWVLPNTRVPPSPPVTQIVLQPPAHLDPVELEFLKGAILASMAPAYAARAD